MATTDAAFAAARLALRRAAGVLVDAAARLAGVTLTPDQREAGIDFVIQQGSITAVDVLGLIGLPDVVDPIPSVKTRPSVVWDFAGVLKGLKRWLQELEEQFSVGADDAWEDHLGLTIGNLLAGKANFKGAPGQPPWKFWVRYCLPQWSKGRKDQPNNARLQRKPPRNAANKPHRSPFGRNW